MVERHVDMYVIKILRNSAHRLARCVYMLVRPSLRNGLVCKLGVRFAKWLWPRPVCKIRPLTGSVCKLVRLKGCFAKQRPFCTFGLSLQTAPKCDRQAKGTLAAVTRAVKQK